MYMGMDLTMDMDLDMYLDMDMDMASIQSKQKGIYQSILKIKVKPYHQVVV